ncbi:MAG: hypothetical protein EHM21_08265, partial [Chloroflexi bacterium]
ASCDAGSFEYHGASTTTLVSSANPSTYGTAVTISATVNPVTAGSVQFFDTTGDPDVLLGTVALNGSSQAAYTLPATLSAGTHTYTATFLATGDYLTGTSTTLSQVVDPKPLTVTGITANDKTYDGGTAASLNVAGATLNGVVGTEDVTLDTSGATGEFASSDVDTDIPVTVSGLALAGTADPDNYTLTQPTGLTADITAQSVTVTADAQTKEYGDADPELTYDVTSGSLVEGDDFTGALTRDAGEDVDTYAITQGTLALSENYDMTYVGADLTITARSVTVTADAQTKEYGAADPELTYDVTSGSLVEGDDFTGALAREAGEDVGTYAITQDTLTLGDNYNLTYVGADLTITVRPVTVTADAQTKEYGDADPELTFEVTSGSLAEGDSFTGALAREAGEDVGTYAISQDTLELNDNYDLTFVGADLTITVRSVTVTADTLTKVYGDDDPELTFEVTSGSLAEGDSFTGALVREAGEDVGTYAITQDTLALNDNYDLTFVGADLEITPAPLTFTADDKVKRYLDDNPSLTYQVEGFKFEDGESDLGGEPEISTTAEKDSRGGTYPITISIGTMANSNYEFIFVNGELTILEFQTYLPVIFR